jgi:hypothetical protein
MATKQPQPAPPKNTDLGSEVLPQQGDERPSIWDLYMAAALASLVGDTKVLVEDSARLAAMAADASIQERKKREGGT